MVVVLVKEDDEAVTYGEPTRIRRVSFPTLAVCMYLLLNIEGRQMGLRFVLLAQGLVISRGCASDRALGSVARPRPCRWMGCLVEMMNR